MRPRRSPHLQSKLSLLFGPQNSHSPHSNRQGPEGPHSQNLLQSANNIGHISLSLPLSLSLKQTKLRKLSLTVLVDMIVRGDVVEEVLAVGDQTPIVGSAVIIRTKRGVGGEPDLLLTDQILTTDQLEACKQYNKVSCRYHFCSASAGEKKY